MTLRGALYSLRAAKAEDEAFFALVFAESRFQEFLPLGLSPDALDRFLGMQFEAQQTHYRSVYPQAERWVIGHHEVDAGILILDEGADLRIVDLALRTEFQGRGIGSEILASLKDRAAGLGLPLVLHVEAFNPARRLYDRMGFQPSESTGVYVRMEWRPADGPRG